MAKVEKSEKKVKVSKPVEEKKNTKQIVDENNNIVFDPEKELEEIMNKGNDIKFDDIEIPEIYNDALAALSEVKDLNSTNINEIQENVEEKLNELIAIQDKLKADIQEKTQQFEQKKKGINLTNIWNGLN